MLLGWDEKNLYHIKKNEFVNFIQLKKSCMNFFATKIGRFEWKENEIGTIRLDIRNPQR